MEKRTTILVTILVIGNIAGWSLVSSQQDRTAEYQQQVEELQWENRELRQQNEDLEWESQRMFDELRALWKEPFDLSGIEESHRSHTIEDILKDSQFWNTTWKEDVDEFSETLEQAAKLATLYFQIWGEWDCSDMATSCWDTLNYREITSVIVVGNLNLDNESFSECNYTWLLVFWEDLKSKETATFILEPIKHEIYMYDSDPKAFKQYMEGYCYTSSFELRTEIEECSQTTNPT